jgi:hypothetical protein
LERHENISDEPFISFATFDIVERARPTHEARRDGRPAGTKSTNIMKTKTDHETVEDPRISGLTGVGAIAREGIEIITIANSGVGASGGGGGICGVIEINPLV